MVDPVRAYAWEIFEGDTSKLTLAAATDSERATWLRLLKHAAVGSGGGTPRGGTPWGGTPGGDLFSPRGGLFAAEPTTPTAPTTRTTTPTTPTIPPATPHVELRGVGGGVGGGEGGG